MNKRSEEYLWLTVAAGSAFLAGIAIRKGLELSWRRVTKIDPPINPAAADTAWTQALIWAGLSGVAAGLARLIGRRGAAAGWRRFTGHLPPGLEQHDTEAPKPLA
ncbi:MAG: DUF4235 domain-containing protein [Candidatus Hydrogenedentales bacterium]